MHENDLSYLSEKVGRPLLYSAEERFKAWATPRVPVWIETHHLTLASLVWALGCLLCGIVAAQARWVLLLVIPLIAAQYVTDVLDGAVGRARSTGLVAWGFYMDHVFDFVFLWCVCAAWIAATIEHVGVWALLISLGPLGCMTHAYVFSCIKRGVHVYYAGLGPTEGRIAMIIATLLLFFVPEAYLPLAIFVLAVVSAATFALLAGQAYLKLWGDDLEGRDWPYAPLQRVTRALMRYRHKGRSLPSGDSSHL